MQVVERVGLSGVVGAVAHGVRRLVWPRRRHRGGCRAQLRVEPLESRLVLNGHLAITEVLASNGQGLQDEDGDRPDWIEIYNAGDMPANLGGWYLTDDASVLNKWALPEMELADGQYLVVFASGKNRNDPASPLHTNFRLAAGGEYLALVDSSGSAAVPEYMLNYPRQEPDIAFGVAQEVVTSVPIALGTTAKVLIPSADNGGDALGTSWTQVGFDDSTWDHGATGVGYERSTGFEELISTDVEASMYGANATAYVRIPFVLDRPLAANTLLLRMKYDGGYVAYLNGVEVARRNAPDQLAWNSVATARRRDNVALQFEDVDLTQFIKDLREGENVLAIHGLNNSARSAEFLLMPELRVTLPGELHADQVGYVQRPTPGAPNGVATFAGLVATPEFSAGRGFYAQPLTVAITSTTPGSTIVYTTDGSRPALENGTLVTPADPSASPATTLHVAQTTAVRAVAIKDGFMPSDVVTQTYFFPADIVAQDYQATLDAGFPATWQGVAPDYGLDPDVIGPNDLFDGAYAGQAMIDSLTALPTISLVMDMDDMFGPEGIYSNPTKSGFDWERPTSVELVYPDGNTGFQVDAGIRIQGNSSRNPGHTKRNSFRLEFRADYGPTKLRFPLFGKDAADRFDTVILRANYNDGWQAEGTGQNAQYVRDEWIRETQLAMGQASSHGTFAHVYINGFYWGLYNVLERPEASFSASYYGGDKDEWDALNTGRPVDGSIDAWRQLLELAKAVKTPDQNASNAALLRLLGRNPDGTENADLEAMIDLGNMIDYLIANFYVGNTDWPGRNWYAARRRGPESTGFKFYSWDAEFILSGLQVDRTGVGIGAAEPYYRLRDNDEFRLLFADHVHQHFFNGGPLYVDAEHPGWDPDHPERNVPAALYARLTDLLEAPIVAESARWGDQHRTDLPYTRADWQAERAHVLADFFPQRSAIVLAQLIEAGLYPQLDAPVFSRHGGAVDVGYQLTMSGPGEIYYTLDGSDPRESLFSRTGGALGTISTNAHKYQGPVTIEGATTVKARTLLNGQWSALNEATFLAGPLPLRISEIMYHPGSPRPGSMFGNDDFEFIEVVNVSDAVTIDLENVAFTRGIEFTFPAWSLGPGERVLVVRNELAIKARYGGQLPIAGEYGNTAGGSKLSNGGERIRIEDGVGRLIQQFSYDDAWYGRTDGIGYSLEMVNAANGSLDDWGRQDKWLPSIEVGGTPGYARSHAEPAPGDLDLNGNVDLEDIDDFVLGLSSPASYRARFGVLPSLGGDIDGDGDLDVDDIAEFVALIGAREEHPSQQSLPVRQVPESPRSIEHPRRSDRRAREAFFADQGHVQRRHPSRKINRAFRTGRQATSGTRPINLGCPAHGALFQDRSYAHQSATNELQGITRTGVFHRLATVATTRNVFWDRP